MAILSAPIIPESSEKIFSALGSSTSVHDAKWEEVVSKDAFVGNRINDIGKLFQKISDKEIKELKKRFGSREEVEKKEKKPKKEKKQKQSKYIKFDDFEKVILKTATVLQADPHPKSDKLLVLTVDDGTRKDRTIVAGIAKYYSPKDLIGQNIVIVDNLKPKKLAGIKSEGMLLAVEDEEGVVLIRPSRKTSSGLRLS